MWRHSRSGDIVSTLYMIQISPYYPRCIEEATWVLNICCKGLQTPFVQLLSSSTPKVIFETVQGVFQPVIMISPAVKPSVGMWFQAKLFCPDGGAAWGPGCSGCTCRLGFEEWSGEAVRMGGELENCSVNYFFFIQTSVSNGMLEI